LDIANIEASQIDEMKKTFKVTEGLSLSLMHVQLNRTKPFLDKKEVRVAMNQAVDRAALVQLANYGYGAPSVQYFPKGYWAYNPAIPADLYKYEPEKAKAALKAAGVPDNWELDTVVPNLTYYLTLAQAVKDQMAAAGITLKLRPVDPVQTAPIFYVQASGDVLISVFGGRADPAQLLSSLFTKGPIQNPGGHTTDKLTQLVSAANEAGDTATRAPKVQAAVKEVADEAMNVVLLHSSASFASTDKLVGFKTWLNGKPEFRGVGIAK
jgi:peptide/nickel transport system substrate-binding protein